MTSYMPIFFTEGIKYKTKEFPELVKEYEGIPNFTQINNDFFSLNISGFLVVNSKIIIIFPKNFQINTLDIRADAHLLLNVFLRYQNEKKYIKEEDIFLNGSENNNNGISSSIELLKDYQNYGFLKKNKNNKLAGNHGNIDWNKTINKISPIFSRNTPIYTSPITSRTLIDSEHLVVKIHKAIITECIQMWGWVMGMTPFCQTYEFPCSHEEALIKLSYELSTTYLARDISVINNMIKYLEDNSANEGCETIKMLSTPFFHFIWESVCSYIFQNEYDRFAQIIPQPTWNTVERQYRISQRPDILFLHEDDLFIIDAKYYNYEKNLPGWHDVVKQMFYKYTIDNFQNKDFRQIFNNVHNVFVFPELKQQIPFYLGNVTINNVSGLGAVHAIAINTKMALGAYAMGSSNNIKEQILLCLKENNPLSVENS